MKCYGRTDVGKRRQNNQDNYIFKCYRDNISLAVVCDGMGGASGGNVASTLAVEKFTEEVDRFFKNAPDILTEGDIDVLLAHAVTSANDTVFEKASDDPVLNGMGTTLVAVLCTEEMLYAVNVGDSRLYVYTNGQLSQITHDHSLVQSMVDAGKLTQEEAREHPSRNIITRAVGIERIVNADLFSIEKEDGNNRQMLLLCTDGLSSYVPLSTMEQVLREAPDGEAAVDMLIESANNAGGFDNITVVLMDYDDKIETDNIPAAADAADF